MNLSDKAALDEHSCQRTLRIALVMSILFIGIACIGGCGAGNMLPIQGPTYISIGSFTRDDVARMVTTLQREGFNEHDDFQIRDEGQSIQVRADVRDRALLLLAVQGDLPFYNFEVLPSSVRRDTETYLRMLESRKREVRQIVLLDTCIVELHLSVPFRPDFMTADTFSAVASGVATFRNGCAPSDTLISAIRRLIINDFPGLSDLGLTLADSDGRPLRVHMHSS